MRTLAITENMSADGSIEFLGDWFDQTDQGADLTAELQRQSAEEEVLLLGRLRERRGAARLPVGLSLRQGQAAVPASSASSRSYSAASWPIRRSSPSATAKLTAST